MTRPAFNQRHVAVIAAGNFRYSFAVWSGDFENTGTDGTCSVYYLVLVLPVLYCLTVGMSRPLVLLG